ncbi:unnamed protein product [Cylindrotheca closterium]|uniref:L domain-like protein n=1 Tax=Cylindrotheca closterium TaxID=2856 RepID=A0AAD2FRA8_9STRA|nr:unnamed protein product [Cylindrotheca closterium]
MPNRIKRIIRSVSSASSKASSDRSYADAYFDEIGFKLGDNSCLGSTESPDNLDGEQILFQNDHSGKLFYESGEDDVDEEDIYNDESVHHDYEEDDQESSQCTPVTTGNHHKFLSPPVGLTEEDVNGKQEKQESRHDDFITLPLDYVVHENPKSKKLRPNQSFPSNKTSPNKYQSSDDIIYHYDGGDNGDANNSNNRKSLEYSPFRPHPISTLGAVDDTDNVSKLDTGRSANTWFFNLDSVAIGDKDFLHKGTISPSVESYKNRAFRVKATIWFLFFLGTFLMVSAIVVLILAFEQGRQMELDRSHTDNSNDHNDKVDLIDHDDNFLTPLAEGWEIEKDLTFNWNRTTEAPTISATDAPTTTPPTSSPTALFTPAQEELLNTLVSVSMDPKLKEGIVRGSPQFRALQWLADDPFLAGYSDNRRLQRWVIATFYFSTQGDTWQIGNGTGGDGDQAIARQRQRQFNESPWMIPTTNECWWYTSHEEAICDGQGRLETLSLDGLELKGSLPTEMGFLTMLKHISLPNNGIEGSMPTQLGNLKHLETLHVTSNKITGAIPTTFGRLTMLESLELQHNQISQRLPLELGNLEALKEFKANDNELEGSIPVEFFSMLDLETLNLQSNNISGEIPTAVAALPFLKELTIQNNEIVGTMPFETCHLSNLIADCDEMICECCTECCIQCQGTIGTIVDTTGTQAPTGITPTGTPTRRPTSAPTRKPSTTKPTGRPTSRPTRTPTAAPTRRPTSREPTRTPTRRPTRRPTGKPTAAPIRSPTTTAPIGPPPDGIYLLVSVGNDGLPENLFPLKMCQGDCDRNRDCAGDLVCYQRTGTEQVPGCLGQGTADRDYCTHPYFIEQLKGEVEPDAGADPNIEAKPSITNPNGREGN